MNIKISSNLKRILMVAGTTLVLVPTLSSCSKNKNNKVEFSISSQYVTEYNSAISDKDLENIPEGTEHLLLTKCSYVTDLSTIPEKCPNLKELSLNNCGSITDLSFIYELDNLQSVKINDIAGLDDDLIKYLEDNNIRYNIDEDDIIAAKKAQKIVDEIITDDMTDEEKVRAIVTYVSKNASYHLSKTFDSNDNPLELTLNEGKGVCAGIAYTTNVLLRLAGVESYEVENTLHAWNLVKVDGDYYYVDVTNLGGGLLPKKVAGFLIEKANFGTGGYLIDPGTTTLTVMSDYDSGKIVIPQELVDDIENNIDERSIFKKYANTVTGRLIELAIIIIGIKKGLKLASKVKEEKTYKKK